MKHFTYLSLLFASLLNASLIGCIKKDVLVPAERNELQVEAKRTAPAKILYVEFIDGVPEGSCLIWSYRNKRDWWGYCSSIATTDVAKVYVKDWSTGERVPNVTVTGNWSEGYSLNGATAKTNTDGEASINGLSGYATRVTFTVTNLSVNGGTYDASKNVMSSVDIK